MAIATAIITGAVIAAGGVAATAIGASQQKKAAGKALEEQRAAEGRQFARAEEASGKIEEASRLTPQEREREQRLLGVAEGEEKISLAEEGLEQRQQTEIERRAGLSGEELLKEVGPETRALLDDIAARRGMTGEELFRREGDIPKALQEQILKDIQDPGGRFEDTLKEQLEISRQEVGKEAARRGVFGGLPEGGIRFEQLGRAGVDLAIKSAQARETARQTDLANAAALVSTFLDLSAKARGETAQVGEAGRLEQERARAELSDFTTKLQKLTETARGRQVSGVIAGQGLESGVKEAAAARTSETELALRGREIGQAERLQEAGLSAIGKVAGTAISQEGIFKPKTPTVPTPEADVSLTARPQEETTEERLRGISGAGFSSGLERRRVYG